MKNERQYGQFPYPFSSLGDDMDSQMQKSWAMEGNPTTVQATPSVYNDKSRENPRLTPYIVENPITIPRSFTLFIQPERPQEPAVRPLPLPLTPHRELVYSAVGDD